MRTCSQCGSSVESESLLCSNCQNLSPLLPERKSVAEEGIASYFFKLSSILLRPTSFFKGLSEEREILLPITFALGTHWLAVVLKFFIQAPFQSPFASLLPSLSSGFFGQFLGDVSTSFSFLTRKERAFGWIFDSMPILLDPFITLFSLGLSSVFLYVGTRILVTPGKNGHPEEISLNTAIRLNAYVMATSIFILIPWIGRGVYALASVLLLPIAIREVYRVTMGRALIISLFPNLFILSLATLGLIASFFGLLFFGLFKFASIF